LFGLAATLAAFTLMLFTLLDAKLLRLKVDLKATTSKEGGFAVDNSNEEVSQGDN
jgi:hypothetical protein